MPSIWSGSLGGNVALKLAGELGDAAAGCSMGSLPFRRLLTSRPAFAKCPTRKLDLRMAFLIRLKDRIRNRATAIPAFTT